MPTGRLSGSRKTSPKCPGAVARRICRERKQMFLKMSLNFPKWSTAGITHCLHPQPPGSALAWWEEPGWSSAHWECVGSVSCSTIHSSKRGTVV